MSELQNQVHFETVIALSEALDAKDKYTAGHSRRVMEYSVGIAQRIGLGESNIEQLKISALLHDIGKIGIPDAILRKKSKLSDEEFAIIKKHPEIGANILKAVDSFKDFIPAVYHHHERFDGKGYPQKIIGEQIPINARIIAIADSFEAMRSNRPYRKAFLLEKALSELERNKGSQFDPHITEVFIEMVKKNPYYFRIMEPEYYI